MPVTVAEDLDLDMARMSEILLDKDAAVAERRLRLASRGLEPGLERIPCSNNAHPAATAAGSRLHHNRISNFFCEFAH